MNDWDIICKLKDAGATSDEALAALRAGGVEDAEKALGEVTA